MFPDRLKFACFGRRPLLGPPGPRRSRRSLVAGVWVAAALATLISPARTAPPALPGPSRDTELTLHARKALLADAQLAPLNLWVSIKDRVATVAGEVPSAGLGRRAADLVNRVAGVGEVRNETKVATGDGQPEWPTAFPQGPPVAGGVRRTSSAADLTSHLAVPPAGLEPVVPENPPPVGAAAGPGVSLGRPVALPSVSEKPAAASPPAAILAPRPLPAEDLATVVEKLRAASPRLGRVRVQVQDGLVSLSGAVERWDDIEELAGAVRRLPGVRAVILENVRIDRASAPGGR